MNFDRFTAPLGGDRFEREHLHRAPVHLPGARNLGFDWARMAELLSVVPHWTEGNIHLVLNSRPVFPDFYMDEVNTLAGRVHRADPVKVEMFMGMGASLVANSVEQIAPEVREITDMLSRRFTAYATANVYCSFDGVQAFATHYDTHEVFALQCQGQKLWRVYANREPEAADPPSEGPDAQARIDAARGPVALQARARPGDLLYIPRGQYHDAVAEPGQASLHITFSVGPKTGRLLSQLLTEAIGRDPAFAAYLPSPDERDGAALAERLSMLADRLSDTVRSPGFLHEVADQQRRSAATPGHASLPPSLRTDHYARTQRPAELRRTGEGVVIVASGRSYSTGAAFAAAEWALTRPAISRAELDARFAHVPIEGRDRLIETLLAERLFEPYTPER